MRVLTHFALWCCKLAEAETQTTEAEREALARVASGRRSLVEIGVWHGVTTTVLRRAMAEDGVLYAVDPFPRGRLGVSFQRLIARAEVARARRGRVEWLRTTGEAAGKAFADAGRRVELVFIDGDHTFEALRGDWTAWAGLVVPGGHVALHDSRSTPARPIDDAGSVRYTRAHVLGDPRFAVEAEVDSLTVLRRLP